MTDTVLVELAALLRRLDPVPDPVLAAARAAFTLALLPPDWTLLEQLPEPAAIRSSTRSLRFRDAECSLHVELRGTRLSGLVDPASPVEVQWPNGSVRAEPDADGFFRVTGLLPRGPLRLVVGRRATRWFSA
jgi:hypothetical protein